MPSLSLGRSVWVRDVGGSLSVCLHCVLFGPPVKQEGGLLGPCEQVERRVWEEGLGGFQFLYTPAKQANKQTNV